MKHIKMPPRYIINPVATPRSLWAPEIYQTVCGYRNPSYLNSLWLGMVWPVLALPYRVVREVLWPLFNFDFSTALLSLVMLPVTVGYNFLRCVTGHVMAIEATIDQVTNAIILSPEQGAAAVFEGHYDVVMDLNAFVYGNNSR